MSKILVVDDEEPLVHILADKLASQGYTVFTAMDGDEGIQAAFKNHPDLILLDLMMPKVDGITALKKIRDDDWGKKVPVLVLTNLSDIDKMDNAVHLQVSGYLVKADWKLEDVVAKIKEVLNSSSATA